MASYFEKKDYKDWDVVDFYRYWIREHQENPKKLDYLEAKDWLIKYLNEVNDHSPIGDEVRKAQILLKKSEGKYFFFFSWLGVAIR